MQMGRQVVNIMIPEEDIRFVGRSREHGPCFCANDAHEDPYIGPGPSPFDRRMLRKQRMYDKKNAFR